MSWGTPKTNTSRLEVTSVGRSLRGARRERAKWMEGQRCRLGSSEISSKYQLGGGGMICFSSHVMEEGVDFSSIPEAIGEIAAGKFVVVLDDKDRENEGDLIIAGEKMTTEAMAFMVEHTSGLVCAAMEGADLDRLDLPLMVDSDRNKELMKTAFTISVDLAYGVTTGISASDRSRTIRKLSDPNSKVSDFQRPGHIFPLRYQPGGVLKRPGHTEAAVDLSRLAGCHPTGVLCEIVDKRDGSMARTPYLLDFAQKHGLVCITIDDLIKFLTEQSAGNGSMGAAPTLMEQTYLQAYC